MGADPGTAGSLRRERYDDHLLPNSNRGGRRESDCRGFFRGRVDAAELSLCFVRNSRTGRDGLDRDERIPDLRAQVPLGHIPAAHLTPDFL